MSDRIIPMHTLACDWPGCEEVASDDMYSCWESYDSAVIMFADPRNDGEWLHTEDGKDYCPKHWHLDDEWNQAVGPEPELMPPWGKSTEEAARSMEAVGQGFASTGPDPKEEA